MVVVVEIGDESKRRRSIQPAPLRLQAPLRPFSSFVYPHISYFYDTFILI